MKTIGDRIRMVRGGKSRDYFAKLINTSTASLQRYENGKRTPDLKFIQSLVQKTGLLETWLLTGEGPMYATAPKGDATPQPHHSSPAGHDTRDELIEALREQLEMQREHIETLKENAKLATDALQRENEALRGQLELTRQQVEMLEELLSEERQKTPQNTVDRIQAAG